jgi:hypothetical protein
MLIIKFYCCFLINFAPALICVVISVAGSALINVLFVALNTIRFISNSIILVKQFIHGVESTKLLFLSQRTTYRVVFLYSFL